eukprot:TRINITY_DN43155_c0_g1_i1.p1 TRINITY_DN43155_c0_g1~~TRINITY_DN43155_c0_g1_i1.p1  ORF type:complete len:149 (+),score=71.06 TRINITY_DN43155_c0_g1_i1:70-516(+)
MAAQQQQQGVNPLPPARQKHYQDRMNSNMQELRDIQQKLQNLLRQQQSLQTQQQENEMVEKELGLMDEGSQVYKLIGPVLVSQDPEDAVSIVTKRLEYIKRELGSVEGGIKDVNKTHEKVKEAIGRVQQEFQQEAQQVLAAQQQQSQG